MDEDGGRPKLDVPNVLSALNTLRVEHTKELVLHLGVKLGQLDDIERECHGSSDKKAHYVDKWFDLDVNASWERLVSALRRINMPVLAAGVEYTFITLPHTKAKCGSVEPTVVTENTPTAETFTPLASLAASQQQVCTSAQLLETAQDLTDTPPYQLPQIPPLPPQPPNQSSSSENESEEDSQRTDGELLSTNASPLLTAITTSSLHPITTPVQSEPPPVYSHQTLPSLPTLPYPYPLPAVSHDSITEVRTRIDSLQDEFTDLMSTIDLALTSKQSDKFLSQFCSFLLQEINQPIHTRFMSRYEDDIIRAKTVHKLIAILTRYCTFCNCDIIVDVVRRFCDAGVKQRMSKYYKSLENFEATTIVEDYLLATSACPGGPKYQEFTSMAAIIPKKISDCKLSELREKKKSIVEETTNPIYIPYIFERDN